MRILDVPKPVSGGIFLSYKCTGECKHCMYACSPRWSSDWISKKDAERVLTQLAEKIVESPLGSDRVDLNHGLHFTGGEPFMNFDLLLELVKMAHELDIPSTFVETNCYWCGNDETTRERFVELRDEGLNGILISVNPFILEYVSPERTERAIRFGEDVFGRNTMVYQEFVHQQFRRLKIKESLPFEEYLQKTGSRSLSHMELLPIGRVPYRLGNLYQKYPARHFFGESCKEELRRNWHVHIDNYGNYVTGYCAGISLGDARDLDSILYGIDLDDRSVINALITDVKELYELGRRFGYEECDEGYISKCHLCVDIRGSLVQHTDEFKELSPRQFYTYLK